MNRVAMWPLLAPFLALSASASATEPCVDGAGACDPAVEPRPVPDYDGRPDPPPSAGEVALWVPRLALAPAYLGWRYVFYPPVRATLIAGEKNHVPRRLRSVFVHHTPPGFPPAEVGIVPTGMVDFGFRPSVGAFGWVSSQVAPWPRTRAYLAWGGEDWWRVTMREQISWGAPDLPLAERNHLNADFVYERRPDHLFWGIGPQGDILPTRFSRAQVGGHLGAHLLLIDAAEVDVGATVTRNRFGAGVPIRDDPSIETVYDTDAIPGFDGYVAGVASADLRVHTRRDGRVAAAMCGGADVGRDLEGDTADFVRTRLRGRLAVDLDGHQRELSLHQRVELAYALDDREIAFTELPTLGGDEAMRGFLAGSMRGPTAFSSALEYTWPVWAFADGLLFGEVGNTFGTGFEDPSVGSMRASMGTGFRTTMADGPTVQLLVGLGTSRMDEPFEIDSARFAVGVTRGL